MRRSTIIRLWLGILLALLVTAALPALDGAAKNVTKESTRQTCTEAGGTWDESSESYSCDFGHGDVLVCDETISDLEGTDGCWWADDMASTGTGGTGHHGAAAVDPGKVKRVDAAQSCPSASSVIRSSTVRAANCATQPRSR